MLKSIEGQRVPNVTFKTRRDHEWVDLSTDDVFAGKTIYDLIDYLTVLSQYKADELEKADEVFVTGTAAEVTPVGQIGDLDFTVGPITTALLEDYEKLVRAPQETSSNAA